MGLLNASETSPEDFAARHGHALTEGENVKFAFKTVRDFIAFTSWRVLHVDVQGLTGSKVQYLTVPYRSINAFALTSAGTLDLDAEIKIFLSGHPAIEFRIARGSDTRALQGWLAGKLDR